jgi:hypothetical protein
LENVPVTLTANASLPVFLGGRGAGRPDIPPEALASFGLRLAAITPELRAKYKLGARRHGVVVTGVVKRMNGFSPVRISRFGSRDIGFTSQEW